MESFIQTALFEQSLSTGLVAAIFLTGLLTSLTPCIYPMLPITVSVVSRYTHNRTQAFFCSLSYVIGLALTYSALGVAAASSGQLFGVVASHPLTLGFVGLVCLCFALWMMGWLRLPQWTPPSIELSPRYRYSGVFVIGAVSGLVMAPCTSPVLGMLLMYVASQGDTVNGGIMMFVFALGMSALLLLAGTFSGILYVLPRSGSWLNGSKYLLATLMVVAALYFFYQAIF